MGLSQNSSATGKVFNNGISNTFRSSAGGTGR